ncbi:hypothetical protein E2C01_033671 [Portunus trituberculatus]|uniref:Uncharacterized protein n=1 Tax=Portunus trituberculatus TaxID=210409 RepID=A0A5B7F3J3_PORTR|nr:hypothetical protein [Portunus trituberculatus]
MMLRVSSLPHPRRKAAPSHASSRLMEEGIPPVLTMTLQPWYRPEADKLIRAGLSNLSRSCLHPDNRVSLAARTTARHEPQAMSARSFPPHYIGQRALRLLLMGCQAERNVGEKHLLIRSSVLPPLPPH